MPIIKMVDVTIKALKPTGPRTDYTDTSAPGLTLRVQGSGKKSWSVRYTSPISGKQQRMTLGRYPAISLLVARGKAHAIASAVADGKDPVSEKQAKRAADVAAGTVAALLTDYVAYLQRERRASWNQTERYFVADVIPKLGDRLVRSITRAEIRALVQKKAEAAPVSANRLLTHISAAFTWGVRNDRLDANVAAVMDDPGGKEIARDRVLSAEEIRQVWDACAQVTDRPELIALTRLRLVTAQRGGELVQLRWSDIEDEVLVIPARVAKNRREHRVPLTATAQALLKSIPRVTGCEYIFFSRRKVDGHLTDEKKIAPDICKHIAKATGKAFEFTAHDLRRTASTTMGKGTDGVSRAMIDVVLNHVDGAESRVSRVYNLATYDDQKRSALETWERKLLAILSPKQRAALAA